MAGDDRAGALVRIKNLVEKYCEKSGTTTHPDPEIAEAVVTIGRLLDAQIDGAFTRQRSYLILDLSRLPRGMKNNRA